MGKKAKRARVAAAPLATREIGTVTYPNIPSRAVAAVSAPATPTTALALPTVYRCAALFAATAQQCPVNTFKGDSPAATPRWMRYPEPWTLRDVIGHWTTSMALAGALYALVTRDAQTGYSFAPVAPTRVGWRGGLPVPDATNVQWTLDNHEIDLLPAVESQRLYGRAYLLHRPLLVVPGYPTGLGPIQAEAAALGYALDVERFGGDLYANPIPQGVLSTEQDIQEDTATRYRDKWINDPAPVRVVGAGLTFSPLRLSPKDAAWIEARQYGALDVVRMFGVPARMLNLPSGDSVTYSTALDNDVQYLRYAAAPYFMAIEDALSQLTPRGRMDSEDVRVRLDVNGLLTMVNGQPVRAVTAPITQGADPTPNAPAAQPADQGVPA